MFKYLFSVFQHEETVAHISRIKSVLRPFFACKHNTILLTSQKLLLDSGPHKTQMFSVHVLNTEGGTRQNILLAIIKNLMI